MVLLHFIFKRVYLYSHNAVAKTHAVNMIEKIISIARETMKMDTVALQTLIDNKIQDDYVLQDYQRDLARALLASGECKNTISILLQAEDKDIIEQTVQEFCRDNNPYIPPVFLLGRALMYKVGEDQKN